MNLFKRCAAFLAVCSISASLLCIQSSAAETSESLVVGDIYSAGSDAYKAWSGSSDGSEYTGYDPGDIFSSGSSGGLDEAYVSYVFDLPANGSNSDGNLLISNGDWHLVENANYFDDDLFVSAENGCFYDGLLYTSIAKQAEFGYVYTEFLLRPGLYELIGDSVSGLSSESGRYRIRLQGSNDGASWENIVSFAKSSTTGTVIAATRQFSTYDRNYKFYRFFSPIYADKAYSVGNSVGFARVCHLVYFLESDSPYIEVYSSNTRPGSLTVNYGVTEDDGTVTSLGEQKIIDESSNRYYNPVTNTTQDISSWSFDYPTRTYDLTLSDESSVLVEFADDGVNITEGDTAYAVCYLVSAKTEPDEPVDPGSCDHTYTCETTTAPTCVLDGVNTFTCSLCGSSYTEPVAATGHIWAVKETVDAVYDEETGELLTEGYTLYECSVCGEQYKSSDGSSPPAIPGGSGGSGGVGSILEIFGTVISHCWDLLSFEIPGLCVSCKVFLAALLLINFSIAAVHYAFGLGGSGTGYRSGDSRKKYISEERRGDEQ